MDRLWVCLILILINISVKYLIRLFMQTKASWVLLEEERLRQNTKISAMYGILI